MKKTAKKPLNDVLPFDHKLGRYTVVKKLSSGGFGVVYLAKRDDGEMVALKEFLPSMISCRPKGALSIKCDNDYDAVRFQEGLKAFFREADTLAHVKSDRVIPIWDVFKENGTAYFAMPVEKGGTLQALLRLRRHVLSEEELRRIFVEACLGVEDLHAKGLLHLDIKPSNLWVRPDRSVLVLDLGASRWEDDEIKNSQMARTPGFAAPEQHSQFKTRGVSVKTDIYGLCASLLSCLDLAPPQPAPFRRPSDPPITESQYGIYSSDLLRLIEKGMAMQAPLRFNDVAALRQDLVRLPRLNPTPPWPERLSPHLPTPPPSIQSPSV